VNDRTPFVDEPYRPRRFRKRPAKHPPPDELPGEAKLSPGQEAAIRTASVVIQKKV